MKIRNITEDILKFLINFLIFILFLIISSGCMTSHLWSYNNVTVKKETPLKITAIHFDKDDLAKNKLSVYAPYKLENSGNVDKAFSLLINKSEGYLFFDKFDKDETYKIKYLKDTIFGVFPLRIHSCSLKITDINHHAYWTGKQALSYTLRIEYSIAPCKIEILKEDHEITPWNNQIEFRNTLPSYQLFSRFYKKDISEVLKKTYGPNSRIEYGLGLKQIDALWIKQDGEYSWEVKPYEKYIGFIVRLPVKIDNKVIIKQVRLDIIPSDIPKPMSCTNFKHQYNQKEDFSVLFNDLIDINEKRIVTFDKEVDLNCNILVIREEKQYKNSTWKRVFFAPLTFCADIIASPVELCFYMWLQTLPSN